MRAAIHSVIGKISAWYGERPERERHLILFFAVIAACLGAYSGITTVTESLAASQAHVASLKSDLDTTTELVRRFTGLQAKRAAIERSFSEMQWSKKDAASDEGEMSYLESLNGKILKITPGSRPDDGFKIKPQTTAPFGKEYERSQYQISFPVTSLTHLVDFLTELSHGERPLLVTRLRVERRASGESLGVTVEVSSIRKKTV